MAQLLLMERLVHDLNDPRNQASPDTIEEVQKQIQRLQREPLAWQLGIDLLGHNEAVMRFYGALTLTIKVNADWDMDKVGEDRDLVNHLLESIISSYIKLAAIPDFPFVLQKLCTTLVAIFQKPQSAWALPIRHLAACTVANRYVPQEHVPELELLFSYDAAIRGFQLKSLLMFPLTLAEQENAISGSTKEQVVRVRTSNNLSDILRLLHFAANSLNGAKIRDAQTYHLSVDADTDQLLDVAKTLLQLLPLWTTDIKIKANKNDNTTTQSNFDLFRAIVSVFAHLFQEETLAPNVMQALTTIEESSHKLLQHAMPRYEDQFIRSPKAAYWLQQLELGDFDPDAVAYMNFLEACMSQVDVTTPDYLASETYIEILKQVRGLLQCEGAPGVDDTVCQVALEILTSVTEGLGDWSEPSPYDGAMHGLIKNACGSALQKIRIPQDELSTKTQTWDADDRAKFQDFRYDVQDYLQNAFSILGDSLIEDIITSVVHAALQSEWDVFEAGIFSLIAFSDTFANDAEKYDRYLSLIFACEKWRASLDAQVNVPDRVRQIMIKFIGENTVFLQRYTDFLVPSLNFLFTSLHIGSLATAASRAIYALCDAQRSLLIEALPQFMSSLQNTSSLEPDAKHRIYGAVGAIVQALPSEADKVQPLTKILHKLSEQDTDHVISSPLSQSDLVVQAIDVLETIAALGRGLRAPTDTPIDLEKPHNSDKYFWTEGPGLVVQHQVLQIYYTLLEQTHGRGDALFIEAACDFLRSGFTEEHPSPFKFSNLKILDLLSTYLLLSCPLPDHVMSTASSYLASVKPDDTDNGFAALILTSISVVNEAFATSKAHSQALNSDFCTATLDFYARLLSKWSRSLLLMPEAIDVVSLMLELGLALVENSDTLPRRSAAAFFTAFLDASAQSAVINDDKAASMASAILENFAPRIFAAIVRLLGGVCARSDIDSLAEVIKKGVSKQPLMTNRLLKEAVKEENVVLSSRALAATKAEQRTRFTAQVEMLRGGRKTNEVIREFWIACKGRDFEYIT